MLLEESVCYDQCILLAKLLAFGLLHSVLQGQTCLLFQISLDFLLLYSSPQEPGSPALHTNSLLSEPPGKPSGKEFACQLQEMQETCVLYLGQKDPLDKEIATHSPVFLLGKFHEQRSLASYSPWGCKELNTTE